MIDRLYNAMLALPRYAKQVTLACADSSLLMIAVWSALALSAGEPFVPSMEQWLLMLAAPLVAVPVFIRMGLYRAVIRYLGEHVLWTILKAMSVVMLLWAVLSFITELAQHAALPKLALLLYWMFGVLFMAGLRFGARWLVWLPMQHRYHGHQALIYGAGEAGRQIAATLREGRDIFPAGFIDDDPSLQGKDVNGLRVYPPGRLSELVTHLAVREVIVALPSVPSARRREIVNFLEQHQVKVRILPEVAAIAGGQHLVNRIREADIGDLLGRDAVAPDKNLLGQLVADRNVLVTGAGGSIGSELCRQITALNPRKLVLLEQSEFALYQVQRALSGVAQCEVVARLGSVADGRMVRALFEEHRIQTVYHAAAYKHVPLVEENPLEGVRNNVLGTLVVARAAFEAGVETFVLISSDKAVRPTNVMGATKRWAELIVQYLAQAAEEADTGQRFCAVRFGNVLGSSGSVIPLFREQIAQGGPVTVTHPEVTRYFMSIHEAVQLVIQAGSLSKGGEIFLLDMGASVKISDLAANMIRLSGRTLRDVSNPTGEIEIVYIGLRPGEKLKEELLIATSNVEGTLHPKIMQAFEPAISKDALLADLGHLQGMVENGEVEAVKALLMERGSGHLEVASIRNPVIDKEMPTSGAQVLPLPLNRACSR